MTALAGRRGVQPPAARIENTAPIAPEEPAASIADWQHACRQHRTGTLTTAGLMVVDNTLRLALPLALGVAINGLLSGSYVGLLILLAQQLGQILAGTACRMATSRLAARIERDRPGPGTAVENAPPRRSAPATLDGVTLFAETIPLSIRLTFSILGALAVLASYDHTLAIMCGLMVVPALLLGISFARKLAELDGSRHSEDDSADTAVFALAGCRTSRFSPTRQVRYADAQAIHVGLIRLFTLGALALVLVHTATNRAIPSGDLFAIICYTLMVIRGLSELPQLLRTWRVPVRAREH